VNAFSARLQVVEGDIRDLGVLKSLFRGASVIFHQAAIPSVERSLRDPLTSNEVNILGTLNVLIAARDCGVPRVIFASSSSVYGDTEELPKHELMPTNPKSPYAVTKMVGEIYCRMFSELYGLRTYALRYFNIFGAHQNPKSDYAAVIPRFITRMLEGLPPIIYGDGEQSRDFTHVSNAVVANLAAAEAEDGSGQAYNVGCGERYSLMRLLDILNNLLGTQFAPIHEQPRLGDVRHSLASITKINGALGFTPLTSFQKGLEQTLKWYQSRSS
jgi:UDP-glucose 4-epimerase